MLTVCKLHQSTDSAEMAMEVPSKQNMPDSLSKQGRQQAVSACAHLAAIVCNLCLHCPSTLADISSSC